MSNIDILIPGALERRYTESVKPALEAAGVTASKSLLQALGKPECASIWSLRTRRPKKGSTLLPSHKGGNWKVGDAIVIFFNGTSPQGNRLIKIESAFGIFASAQPVNHDEESEVDWEEHTLLAISTDFITIIADILPGNDAFVGVAVWMNSLLPLYIFAQKPLESVSTLSIRDYKSLQESDVILKAPCKRCAQKGTITCERCDGAGKWQPDGKCNKCEGSTTVECSRCGGRGGGFTGKHGETISHCNRCSGTGNQTCFVCKGSGEPPILPCNSCNGTGILTCRPCLGSGAIKVEFDSFHGKYKFRNQTIPAKDVQAFDVKSGIEYSLKQAAEVTLKLLNEESRSRSAKKEAVKATQDEIKKIDLCLGLAMEPLRTQWQNLQIEVGHSEATTKRITKGTVLRFSVSKHCKSKIKEWEECVTRNQLVRLGEENKGKPDPKLCPTFQEFEVKDNTIYLYIGFPDDIEIESLPAKFFVTPVPIPPSEKKQQKELTRWCDPDTAPKLIEAISKVESPSKTRKPAKINAIDPHIKNNRRQQEALDLIMSGAPLVLVKGPPGTGKTSLIKEVILQSLIRGEKVLVCSETHTAVANVLERLNGDERIRMIRRGRPDDDKLTETEKEYLKESRQGYLQSIIHESTDARKSELKSLKSQLEKLPDLLKSAYRSALEVQEIELDREQKLNPLKRKVEKFIERHDEIVEIKKKHNRSMKESRDAFRQRNGRDPDKIEVAKLKETIWESITPNKIINWPIASDKLLTKRYNEARRVIVECESKIGDIRSAINQNKLEQKEIEKSAEDAKRPLLSAQNTCSNIWNAISCLPPIRSEGSPEEWNDRIAACNAIKSEVQEKIDFIESWIIAIEGNAIQITQFYWDTLNVFMSTCVGLASWKLFNNRFGKDGVDLVIIDEAAHATLTQSLIPMGRARRAVLIGDEMQLPPAAPMNMGSQCEEHCTGRCPDQTVKGDLKNPFKPLMSPCWLERSAFEWIVETRPSVPVVMLNRQFRMHPDIADFVGSIFYGERLENGVSAADRILEFDDFQKAVCVISTSADQNRFDMRKGSSFENSLEVNMTREILGIARDHLSKKTSFGVITPYAAQRDLMRSELHEYFGLEGHLKMGMEDIGSVDSFQGSEWDVMIASFVRSPRSEPTKCRDCAGTGELQAVECPDCGGRGYNGPRLDWVHDLRRLNVAFSRARKMLILIGDVKALTDARYGTAAGAEILKRFKDHVTDRGRVLHVWEQG